MGPLDREVADKLAAALGEKVLDSSAAAISRIIKQTYLGPTDPTPADIECHDGDPTSSRELTSKERECPIVASFDKNGAYLDGIGMLRLGHGAWTEGRMVPLPKSDAPAYWLIDELNGAAFQRDGSCGARWFTTPLARLAAERGATTALRVFHQSVSGTPLHHAALRIGIARAVLMVDASDSGREALAELKHIMETCVPLLVPLKADGGTGVNWGEIDG